jgi:aspartokinase
MHSNGSDVDCYKNYEWIVQTHAKLRLDMGISDAEYLPVTILLDELKRLLDGILLTGEVSPKLRARVAAFGELLSSQLGLLHLKRSGNFNAVRVDSRSLLTSDIDDSRNLSEADIYLEADVRPSIQPDRANAAALNADVVICQGFIASTPTGATCLLGRGGSDTSGALFASLVNAQRLEIWTDVNGMFTADPRYVSQARLIRSLTYREAQELAAMGAKVLHPRCLLPAAHAKIPVEVRNTMDPSNEAEITVVSATGLDYLEKQKKLSTLSGNSNIDRTGTPSFRPLPQVDISEMTLDDPSLVYSNVTGDLVALNIDGKNSPSSPSSSVSSESITPSYSRSKSPSESLNHHTPVVAINHPHSLSSQHSPAKVLAVARRKGVTLVTMSAFDMWGNSGFLTRVFAPFTTYGVSIDLIATSQYAVSITLDHIPDGVYGDTFRRVISSLSKECTTEVRYPCAVVSVVGRALRNALPQIGSAMRALDGVPVHMVSEACEDLNMSFVVDEEYADKIVSDLHASLLESPEISKDAQFGPIWRDLPSGKAPLPENGKS